MSPVSMSIDDPPIASVYKYFFLYLEPISAFTGAYYSFFQQETYLVLTHASSAPNGPIPISTQIVLNQLANLYFLFAINEALILRSSTDLKVWRTILFCLLLADFGHLYSVNAIGWDVYWKVLKWNAIDWGNVGFVYVGALMRLSFLLGLGMARPGHQGMRRSTRKKRPSSRISG